MRLMFTIFCVALLAFMIPATTASANADIAPINASIELPTAYGTQTADDAITAMETASYGDTLYMHTARAHDDMVRHTITEVANIASGARPTATQDRTANLIASYMHTYASALTSRTSERTSTSSTSYLRPATFIATGMSSATAPTFMILQI